MNVIPAAPAEITPAVQTFVIDGCKINIRYAKEANPKATSRIKEISFSGISTDKNTKICTN